MNTCQGHWTCPKFDTTDECRGCPFRREEVYDNTLADAQKLEEENDRRAEARMKYNKYFK